MGTAIGNAGNSAVSGYLLNNLLGNQNNAANQGQDYVGQDRLMAEIDTSIYKVRADRPVTTIGVRFRHRRQHTAKQNQILGLQQQIPTRRTRRAGTLQGAIQYGNALNATQEP